MKTYLNQFYLFVAGLTMLAVCSFIALAPSEYLMSMGAQTDMGVELHQILSHFRLLFA